jgi:hypothetical protein
MGEMTGRREFHRVLLTGLGGVAFGCSAGPRPAIVTDGGAEDAEAGPQCADGPKPPQVGAALPPAALQVYLGARGSIVSASTCDYLDLDGSRGIAGTMILISALWCLPCGKAATFLAEVGDAYLARGARIIDLVIDGAASDKTKPPGATLADVDTWITKHPTPVDVGLGVFSDWSLELFPVAYYVDPRTGLVTYRGSAIESWDETGKKLPELDAILKANGR